MELSKYLREYALTVASKEQMVILAFARALEVIPRQLADNAGFDSTNILNQLRQKHSQGAPTLPFKYHSYNKAERGLVLIYLMKAFAIPCLATYGNQA